MKVFLRFITAVFVFIFLIFSSNKFEQTGYSQNATSEISLVKREEAYRANNLGVALLEQFKHKEAVDEFRKALSLNPQFKLAQINLAIGLFYQAELTDALAEAKKAVKLAPENLQPHYILGLIARTQNRTEDAEASFRYVLKTSPNDIGANVNLAQIYIQQQKYKEAVELLRIAVKAEPYNTTAVYNLATALLRVGEREEGQSLIKRFQELRKSGAATSIGQNYLEQGRYAEALTSTGAEPELVEKETPKIVFQNADIGFTISDKKLDFTKTKGSTFETLPNIGATLFDFDNDGDLDLAQIFGESPKINLFRNDSGKFKEISETSGDLNKSFETVNFGVVAGDYDNDGLTDLLIFGKGQTQLFRNTGNGNFKNVTSPANIPKSSAISVSGAFVDADHDGDLDIFLGGFDNSEKNPNSNQLLRNNGDGTFTDISEASGINVPARAVAVIPTDYDNRRDVDFLVLNYDSAPQLWKNLRDGTFENVAAEVGLGKKDRWLGAAAGDFNKDSFTDFFFGRAGRTGVFAVSDGQGNFVFSDAPAGTENTASAQFLDYDNDGLLDLVAQTDRGFVAVRNLGNKWSEADRSIFKNSTQGISRQMLSGDVDGDGDIDLLNFSKTGGLQFLRNEGGERKNSEIVNLTGRVSNKTGIGAKIEMRSGSLTQKLETYAASPAPAPADIHFGLGRREKPDAVRVLWTSGIIQAEIDFPAEPKEVAFQPLKIEELDRKPSSCPYLYAWNGERFEFITDFLGGGEMGYLQKAGVFNYPDSDEFVRIAPDQLKPRNGRYELRVTNELEEVLFLDHLKLLVLEHDADTEVYPNEGLGIPTAGERILYTTRNARPPVSAVDGKGRDVLPAIKKLDRKFYDGFEATSLRGYAAPHELILTLDERKNFAGRTLLLLTGWTDYAFSSDNLAASQKGKALSLPKLQVKNKDGKWQTVIESIGISVGRPQTLVVDLTGKFLSDSREVRIVTNFMTYWDKIEVDTSTPAEVKTTELKPSIADLSERGFSEEVKFNGMLTANYEKVINDGRWKYFTGYFTRLGDVSFLLESVDDIFVISKTGDELALSFTALPAPPAGKKHTFLLYADGYSKEMDINSASPDAVLPLPFKNMKKYPYGSDEEFPMTEEKRRIYDEYTTRQVRTVLPRLETALIK